MSVCNCPYCGGPIEVRLDIERKGGDQVVASRIEKYLPENKTRALVHQELINSALAMLRGHADRYQTVTYYDNDQAYHYHIQIRDSPQGDSWISGTFKMQGRRIEFLERCMWGDGGNLMYRHKGESDESP